MQFDKAICAKVILQGSDECDEAFSVLLRRLGEMPAEERGAEALRLSAILVELAAYELAGHLDSEQVGALIHCSADLEARSEEANGQSPQPVRKMVSALQ